MKQRLLPLLCEALALYFRYFPLAAGKQAVWDRVVRRYLLWRGLPTVATLRCGARLTGNLSDLIHGRIYFFGVWEPGITWLLRTHLRPGDGVIDIGANVGTHSLLAAHLVGPRGWVVAIEASPAIFRVLQGNIRQSHATAVEAINVAVSDRVGTIPIYLEQSGNLGATTTLASEAAFLDVRQEALVEAKPLPAIVAVDRIRAARLIKIDVEGAEWLVLQGMQSVLPLLAEDCVVLVEVTARALQALGGSLAALVEMFSSAGLTAFCVTNRYDVGFYARPPRSFIEPVPWDAAEFDLGFARPAVLQRLAGRN